MKVIQLKKNVIDVPFQNEDGNIVLTLQFDRSDAHVKEFYALFEGLEKKIKRLEKNQEEPSWDEAEVTIKEMSDGMLGQGSYDKMYELNPSVAIVAGYLYIIAIGIKEELEAEDLKAVEDKYLS